MTQLGAAIGQLEVPASRPVRAYKAARVVVYADGSAGLMALTSGAYGVTASARCLRGPGHRGAGVPALRCSCGFHALADRWQLAPGVLSDVQLWGRVVVHQRGYRAEHQRVLRVVFGVTGHLGCQAPGVQLAAWWPAGSRRGRVHTHAVAACGCRSTSASGP